ncbi:MAG: respiratory nitrate reductase subunit gamma [Bacteroidales bacterium]|nr:respiratory nitrate reductase subunit gamma [Bacteroidales bacterium]
MSDIFLLIALPYTALIVMLVGSVYVYGTQAYKVTSLSTQFLESRELFFGGLFMHWGIVALFIGHLIAFLFPSAVIAWGGNPVRLIVLEVTALIFGISFFTGVIILIYRRMRNKRLHRATTDMDIVVFIVLLAQAVTGMWIALTYKWGSAWFAAVLTPYLRSLFLLSPDLAAVSAMPIIVKLHISTAFVLIGLIPFSRFMHFLVFPVKYFWRPFQVVIWNRNRKLMRNSKAIMPEVKSKNS